MSGLLRREALEIEFPSTLQKEAWTLVCAVPAKIPALPGLLTSIYQVVLAVFTIQLCNLFLSTCLFNTSKQF